MFNHLSDADFNALADAAETLGARLRAAEAARDAIAASYYRNQLADLADTYGVDESELITEFA